MESISKFKCHFLMTLFFLVCYETSSAQEIYNYNESVLNSKEKAKISAILNSNSIQFSNNHTLNKTSQDSNTLDIDYLNLTNLNQVNKAQILNIKNCIVRISTPISSINLNALNQFSNLEIVHLIIETNAINGNIPSLIIMNNPQVLISYQISIPE